MKYLRVERILRIASGLASGSVTKYIATAVFQTAQNHSFQ